MIDTQTEADRMATQGRIPAGQDRSVDRMQRQILPEKDRNRQSGLETDLRPKIHQRPRLAILE
jgi:hypothetical protein